MEYSTLGLDAPYDLKKLHEQRQAVRDEISALEVELANCKEEDMAE